MIIVMNSFPEIDYEPEEVAEEKPRQLTHLDIDNVIGSVHYFTAAQGAAAAYDAYSLFGDEPEPYPITNRMFTHNFCVITLVNGFVVTGESNCADTENYDAEVGRFLAYQDAEKKIWPLLEFLVAEMKAVKKEDENDSEEIDPDFLPESFYDLK